MKLSQLDRLYDVDGAFSGLVVSMLAKITGLNPAETITFFR
jgi:hypothetical protein